MKLGTKLENAIREAWDRGYRVTDSGELISPACRTLESNRELLEADVVILRRHYWAIRGDAKKLPNGAMRYLCDTYQLTRTAINKIVRRIAYAEIA